MRFLFHNLQDGVPAKRSNDLKTVNRILKLFKKPKCYALIEKYYGVIGRFAFFQKSMMCGSGKIFAIFTQASACSGLSSKAFSKCLNCLGVSSGVDFEKSLQGCKMIDWLAPGF